MGWSKFCGTPHDRLTARNICAEATQWRSPISAAGFSWKGTSILFLHGRSCPNRLFLQLANATILHSLLNAISLGKGQIAHCEASASGLKISVEDSQRVQATAFLYREVFEDFEVQGETNFCVSVSAVAESISSCDSSVPMEIIYAGQGHRLLMTLRESSCVTDISVRTVDDSPLRTVLFQAVDFHKIILQSDWLRETLAEFDWSGRLVTVTIAPGDPVLEITVDGAAGSMRMSLDKGHAVVQESPSSSSNMEPLSFAFLIGMIQPAFKALSLAESTALRLNENGILSVQHRIVHENDTSSFLEFYVSAVEEAPQSLNDDDDD